MHTAYLRIVFGAFVAVGISGGSAVSQDWLGSDYQEPLPQYQQKSRSKAANSPRPTAQQATPAAESPAQATSRAEELPSRVPSASGNLLTPNPLKSLLQGGSPKTTIPKPLPLPEKAAAPSNFSKTAQPQQPPSKLTEPKSVIGTRPGKPNSASPAERPTESVKSKKQQRTSASVPQKPVIRYDIYRDANTFPLDPRKPNNPCTRGADCGCSNCRLTGVNGKPYKPSEPGGYNCGKKCPHKRPQFSMYWPRPFSAKLDEAFPGQAAARYQACQKKKLVDVFDCLTNFQLLDYHRIDNGYTGRESDPYGCLGESKIFGLGFRPPGEPGNPAYSPVGYPIGN